MHSRSRVLHSRPKAPDVELGNRQKQEQRRRKQVKDGRVGNPGSFQSFKTWTDALGWHWLKTEPSTLPGWVLTAALGED